MKRNIVIFAFSLLLVFLSSISWAEKADANAEKSTFTLEIKSNLIILQANQESFKEMLIDLEKKIRIKVNIFDRV